jgi:hypothetical protein
MKRACWDAKHAQGGVQVPKNSKSGSLIITRMEVVVAAIRSEEAASREWRPADD